MKKQKLRKAVIRATETDETRSLRIDKVIVSTAAARASETDLFIYLSETPHKTKKTIKANQFPQSPAQPLNYSAPRAAPQNKKNPGSVHDAVHGRTRPQLIDG